MTCQHCGVGLEPPQLKWCSHRCRKQGSYTGTCIDCGGRTGYSGTATPRERCHACANAKKKAEAKWTRETLIAAIRAWNELYGCPPGAWDWSPRISFPRGSKSYARRAERFFGQGWPNTTTVQKVFGSWNAGVVAAGFTPRGPGDRK